jgi:hypothetical protein
VVVMIVRVPMVPMHGAHLAANRANGNPPLTLTRTPFS